MQLVMAWPSKFGVPSWGSLHVTPPAGQACSWPWAHPASQDASQVGVRPGTFLKTYAMLLWFMLSGLQQLA
jgi:hypothetical protein